MNKTCNFCGWSNLPAKTHCVSCARELATVLTYAPQTQKAKGIKVTQGISFGASVQAVPVKAIFPVKGPTPKTGIAYTPAPFARPCPPSPEHGFVESRIVKSYEELEALRVETLVVNEDSEILVMPMINATINMIWTPGLLTVGPGHDGATSGKGVVSFPLAGLNPIPKIHLNSAGLDETKWPYIEAVQGPATNSYGENYSTPPSVTQLRSGPILKEISLDFIPEEITVGVVVKTAGEDLLEWAKKVKFLAAENAAGPVKTVVWHPTGGITDHFSVHCREQGVPIMLSREPIVGEVLISKPLDPPDAEAMKLGVIAGNLYTPATHHRQAAVVLALMALHNSVALRGPYSFWLGVASSLLLKLGSAGLRGEARHAHNATSKIRSDVYDFYIPKSISFHRASLSRVTQILTYGFGDPEANHSFGGKKWGACGASLAPLFNAVRDLFLEPSSERASALIQATNVVVNQAHNGGWWLNKFCTQSAYNEIPTGSIGWALQAAMPIFEVSKLRDKASEIMGKMTKEIQSWPETRIASLRWRNASLDVTPGAFILNLKAATVPTAMQIAVPVTPALLKSLIKQVGKIEMDHGQVSFVTPEGTKVPVWHEVVLDPEAAQLKK